MASSGVFIGNVVTSMVFVSFTAGSLVSDAFYVYGEVITRLVDDK